MKIELVEDWRKFLTWYSTWSSAAVAALLATWALLPEKMQNAFSPTEIKIAAIVIVVLGAGGRLLKQGEGANDGTH